MKHFHSPTNVVFFLCDISMDINKQVPLSTIYLFHHNFVLHSNLPSAVLGKSVEVKFAEARSQEGWLVRSVEQPMHTKSWLLLIKDKYASSLPWYIEFLGWKRNTHQNIRSMKRKYGRYFGNTVASNWLGPVRHPCYVWIRVWTGKKDLSKYLVVFVYSFSYLDFTVQYCRYCIFKDIAKFVCLRNKGFMATVS